MGNYPEASASASPSLDAASTATLHHHKTTSSPKIQTGASPSSSSSSSADLPPRGTRLQAERERTRRLQAAEVNCTADELRTILRAERLRMEQYILQQQQQQQHPPNNNNNSAEVLEAEVLVEGQLEGMMQHLDVLQAEKGRLAAEIQREEEWVRRTRVAMYSYGT